MKGTFGVAPYYQVESITCIVVVPICFSTMCYLFIYITTNKLSFLFYLRPLIALLIILVTYLMTA